MKIQIRSAAITCAAVAFVVLSQSHAGAQNGTTGTPSGGKQAQPQKSPEKPIEGTNSAGVPDMKPGGVGGGIGSDPRDAKPTDGGTRGPKR